MSDLQGNKSEVVSVDAARRADPVVREPDALAIKEAENAHAQGISKIERGLVGWVMGSKGEKAGNIAFSVILFCFLIMIIGFFKFDFKVAGEFESFLKLAGLLLPIVSGALGYIFGAAQKNNKD